MSPTRRTATALLAPTLALTLAACSGTAPKDSTPSPSSPSSTSTSTSASPSPDATTAAVVDIPQTPVGIQVQWTLDALVPEASVDPADAESRLTPAALAQLDGAALAAAFASIAPTGPWEPIAYEGDDSQAMVQLRDSTGERLDLTVVLSADGLIEQLHFAPGFEHTAATSWDELETAVAALPAETNLVVTDVSDPASPREIVAVGQDSAFPVGSIFKLYVLGAVTDAGAEGTLAWDDVLVVTDDVKSLPSGLLQDAPDGTEITVQEAALQMISISDNTATDMLIDAVGRDAVQDQLAVMGHSDPDLNIPFLTTRELFLLGWADGGANRAGWAAAAASTRDQILADLPAGRPQVAVTDVVEPVWQDGIDWFASPTDLVAAQVALQEKAKTEAGAPLAEILGTNAGIVPELAATFDSLAFKGGSSMGVFALSWYVSGEHGDHVVTLQARTENTADIGDARAYFASAQDALALISEGK